MMIDCAPSSRTRLPRWVAPIIWTVMGSGVHLALPWVISLLSFRHGWIEGRPGAWNLFSLILVMAGLLVVMWCVGLHFIEMPRGWELEMTPKYLLARGPYKFTRNPMYLSALMIWLGWTLFYGSASVFGGLVVIWVMVTFIAVPFEERRLEARFGETYLRYKNEVPRWLGKVAC